MIVPGILIGSAVVLTLFFAFIIYTQVEIIRLYTIRWKQLGSNDSIEEMVAPDEPDEIEPQVVEEDASD